MTLSRVKWGAVTITGLLLLVIALSVALKLQSLSKVVITQQNRQLAQQKAAAEMLATNVLRATALFSDIARATQDANQAGDEESERRVVVIQKLVRGNSCATEPVPRPAADQLRAHRDKVRTGSASTDTGESAG
ncbi:hypothetical protein [Pantoea agglomerans]|uniref:hypothetical protein n=1 Tax=Enterobacter agglomerans TaxID=549 RepID=UPI0013E905D9|nr:hypothetical protein [Pantoea agglomerans]MBA8870121.1 hypothetical protein [Pantoea agglomerans]MBA8874500.1 hypothetical protein [Pantoea agglomerans]